MGFAELSIADLAAEYDLETQAVFELCDRFNVNYKNERICLALGRCQGNHYGNFSQQD